MFKKGDLLNFIVHDILFSAWPYFWGVILCMMPLVIPHLSLWTLIEVLPTGEYNLEKIKSLAIPGKFIDLLFVGLVVFVCYKAEKRRNEKYDFHKNGTGYLDWPFWLLTMIGKALGYKSINTINIPIWLQFKIYLSSWWDTRNLEEVSISSKNDPVKVEFKKAKQGDKSVNVVLVDTYEIVCKIPAEMLEQHDTLIVSREYIGAGNRTFNQNFVDDAIHEISQLYKTSYSTMNLFLSTNPFHTQRIVKGAFRVGERERHMKVIVFQSIGTRHEYSELHVVIK